MFTRDRLGWEVSENLMIGQAPDWITDKPEGVGVRPDGTVFVVTDNDGVDGSSGETIFRRLGPAWALFQ